MKITIKTSQKYRAAVEPVTMWRPDSGMQVLVGGIPGVHLVLRKLSGNIGPITSTWELLNPDGEIIKSPGWNLKNPHET